MASTPRKRRSSNPRLFSTPEARRIKEEICAVGRKLWLRQFVDGNGGNISYRVGPNEILCTPTLLSKYDLTPKDLCMVDLEGNQIAGARQATTEILLHLEIYKNVPKAKSVLHCHPPHATGYAVAGLVPPNNMIPEYEIFVGKVAMAPYETPGTTAFARTVLPFVKNCNTVLLKNHGVVTWAESPTWAEWNCEVLETYCVILGAAAQLEVPFSIISPEKCVDLMARKKRMGLPDLRFAANGHAQEDVKHAHAKSVANSNNNRTLRAGNRLARLSPEELEAVVQRVTRAVLEELNAG